MRSILAPWTDLSGVLIALICIRLEGRYCTGTPSCSVTCPSGTYRGRCEASVLKPTVKYCRYTDLQYGERILNGHRFGKSRLAKPLGRGVYDATEDRVVCAQAAWRDPNPPESREDCLFLNVYTPQIDRKCREPLRAVMVFTHGGDFTIGSKTSDQFGADFLVPHGVVLVTVNYRLGPLGFLNLGIPECSGNMGLRDQVVALKWIRKNIKSFGGDADNVTVFGHSAGGMSIYSLYLSPLGRGLFHRMIIMGAIRTDRLTMDIFVKSTTVHYSIEYAKFLGYEGDTDDRLAILRYLRGLNVTSLTSGYDRFMDKLAKVVSVKNGRDLLLGTIRSMQSLGVEDVFPCGFLGGGGRRGKGIYFTTDDTFFYACPPFWLSQDHFAPNAVYPASLEELGRNVHRDIPCMMGYDNADGVVYIYPYGVPVVTKYVKSHLDLYVRGLDPNFAKDKRTLKKAVERVKDYYYGPCNEDNTLDETVRLLTYCTYDDFYRQIAILSTPYVNHSLWVYELAFGKGFKNWKEMLLGAEYVDQVKGVGHGEENSYLFYGRMYFPNGFHATKSELKVMNEMTTWWTNFAKYGNPNSKHDSIKLEWEPTSPSQNNYLRIDKVTKFFRNRKISQEEHEFFDKLRAQFSPKKSVV